MNSYNDNLHNTIVSSLLNQELEKKQIYSQANAAMFSLYHAEAATITAQSKLTTATEDQTAKQAVNDQSVDATNISNNLVSAADQSNTYLKQAVTNTSVGAANVQIATNAIVKLAGDMGTVFSIVNAADFQSDIYDLTTDAYALINNTAQLAEVASDTAMNTSIKTSEVPGSAVLTKAKNSNTALGNLYSITTSDFNNASAVVATDTVNVATASVAEEKAQGTFENLSVEYRAAFSAYRTMNSELNLGLSTLHMPGMNDTSRNISFSLLRSPFPVLDKTIKAPLGPVQTYYVMLVKDQSKTTFSIVNAEAIVLNENAKQFIKIDGTNYTNYLPSATEPQQKTSTKKSAKTGAAPEPGSTTNPTRFSFSFDFFNMDANTTEPTLMVDSDGDPIALGTDYVLFVMAVYTEAYKKKLNTFDDYLSAGSVKFTLTHKLEGVTATSITLGLNTQAETQAAHPFAFNFPMSGNAGYTVQYRCMLLPYGTEEVPTGMMNELSFLELQADLLRMQQEADSYDAQISGLNEKLAA
ncbi:MAG TPA: hypothetical protein VFU15_06015, partial [Bacteroidia bacterium]|nr:hypothetical protein [Bacteroidia bacterium]